MKIRLKNNGAPLTIKDENGRPWLFAPSAWDSLMINDLGRVKVTGVDDDAHFSHGQWTSVVVGVCGRPSFFVAEASTVASDRVACRSCAESPDDACRLCGGAGTVDSDISKLWDALGTYTDSRRRGGRSLLVLDEVQGFDFDKVQALMANTTEAKRKRIQSAGVMLPRSPSVFDVDTHWKCHGGCAHQDADECADTFEVAVCKCRCHL